MKSLLLKSMFVLFAVAAVADAGTALQEKTGSEAKASESQPAEIAAAQIQEEKEHSKDGAFSGIEMHDICGKKVKLDDYKGKVVLVVNVASRCGFTGQYGPLQAIYDKFNDQGLEVIAFPCNQFGKQEPGDAEQISHFCKKRFSIKFDIFSKVNVKGKDQAELFKRLTSVHLEPAGKGDIKWNFEKFIIGKDGKPMARFRSEVHPNSDAILKKIKEALAADDEDAEAKPKAGKIK